MDSTTQADFLWLMSTAAEPLLEQTQAAFCERMNPVRIAKTLRKRTSAARAAMIMEQSQLRIRARVKFTLADQMFLTRRGLEQATGENLARYKAARFAGLSTVVDVCCGIGGDLIPLIGRSAAQSTIGIDSHPLTTLFARHNAGLIDVLPNQSVQVSQIEFEKFDFSDCDGIHCDPDRRVTERTVVGARFSPPLGEVFRRIGARKNLAVKVAPATPISADVPVEVQREWIGDRRECKQQIIWHGSHFSSPGFRTATYIEADSVHQLSISEEDLGITIEISNRIQRYLYEPHPSVLAAGLTNALAVQSNTMRMAVDVDYLTSTQPIEHPLLTRFEVVELFSMDLRRTVEFLKKREIGSVEIKKRGVGKVLVDQFERMKISGPHRATVFLTRIGSQRIVAIARRRADDFPI